MFSFAMIVYRYSLFLGLILSDIVKDGHAFAPIPVTQSISSPAVPRGQPMPILRTTVSAHNMAAHHPSSLPNKHKHFPHHDLVLTVTSVLLVWMMTFGAPRPLMDSREVLAPPPHPIHSTTNLVSKGHVTTHAGRSVDLTGLYIGPMLPPVTSDVGHSVHSRPLQATQALREEAAILAHQKRLQATTQEDKHKRQQQTPPPPQSMTKNMMEGQLQQYPGPIVLPMIHSMDG